MSDPGLADMREQAILHVEDDDAAALLVQTALEINSAQVSCHRVSDVDHALDFLSKTGEYEGAPDPSLILLDLNLPRKSGFDLLAIVRASKPFSHIHVIVFTSSSAASDRTKSLALGANAYFRKPATFEGYVNVLADIVKMIPKDGEVA